MILRYSMLDSFMTCPAACKRQYVDGKKEPDTSATHFGTALHLAIKSHYEGLDGIAIFCAYWDSLETTPMVYYRHSWTELRNLAVTVFLPRYFKQHAKAFTNPRMEEELTMPWGPHTLQGTFDLCAEYENQITMVDYKTSTKLYPKDKILRNPQLWIYCELYRQKYGVLPKQVMYKVFVKSEDRIQTFVAPVTEYAVQLHLQNLTGVISFLEHAVKTQSWPHSFDCYCDREVLHLEQRK